MKKTLYFILGLIAAGALTAQAAIVYMPVQGGTGTSITPSQGYVLVGQSNGTYAPQATSTLGISSSGGTWGGITGTLSNQSDLQIILDTKLPTTTAKLTYQPIGSYITNLYASTTFPSFDYASSTYYFQSNPIGYITLSSLSPYITIATANLSFPSFDYGSTTYQFAGIGISGNCVKWGASNTITDAGSACGSGSSGGSGQGWNFGSGFIYNGTTTDQVLIGETTPSSSVKLDIAGGVNISNSGMFYQNGLPILFASSTNQDTIAGFTNGYKNATSSATVGNNTFFGYQAGNVNTSGTGNTVVGSGAFAKSSTSVNNTIIGYKAFNLNAPANTGLNTVIGASAMTQNTGVRNTVIGAQAGNSTQAADDEVIIGYDAFHSSTQSGSKNIIIGSGAATTTTSGASNIMIGYNTIFSSPTASNQLDIGNLLFGTGIDGLGTNVSSGNIGVGTSTPGSKLTVENGDIYIASSTKGIVLKSPDGTCYRFTVANGGTLNTGSSMTCP